MGLRILHLLNHLPNIGNGIVNVTVDLICSQHGQGHEVTVASAGGELEAVLAEQGIEHHYLDPRKNLLTAMAALRKLRLLVLEFQPDIVHVHMMAGALLARTARPGLRYRIVSTVHNEFQRSAVLMGLADRVIAVSGNVKQNLIQRGIGHARIDVVRNGSIGSVRRQFAAAAVPPALARPAIVTVAGLYHRKGIADLIDGFASIAAEHPAAHLYIVGNGPDREEFKARAQRHDCSARIHFEGFQPDVHAYLRSADIFVLASHREPFGLVLAEAREAGLAIIGTRVDGIPEVLEDGARGLLVPSSDPPAIAAALGELLASPKVLAEWKSRASTNTNWLHVDRMATETTAVYERCLSRAVAAQTTGDARSPIRSIVD